VASLPGLFKSTEEEKADNDKLVDLFRNRVELKKEFAALREEKYRMQDRIKQHEGATARVQQKMDHLENLLLDRDWVYNVVTFYQLRRLAADCNLKLSRFAEQLKQQREKKVQSKAIGEWNLQREEQAGRIESQMTNHRVHTAKLQDELQSERHKLMAMNGISKLFGGRRLEEKIGEIAAAIETSHEKENKLTGELEKVHQLNPPDNEGLADATKRSINFMILSFAQQLYLHYADDDLARIVKEASEKSVGAINYGSKSECDDIVSRIDTRSGSMANVADYADVLQKRAQLIAEKALFRSDDDVVPAAGSVQTVYAINANGLVKEIDVDILGDNYFGVAKVLSR
jgi:hypothetical protein